MNPADRADSAVAVGSGLGGGTHNESAATDAVVLVELMLDFQLFRLLVLVSIFGIKIAEILLMMSSTTQNRCVHFQTLHNNNNNKNKHKQQQ